MYYVSHLGPVAPALLRCVLRSQVSYYTQTRKVLKTILVQLNPALTWVAYFLPYVPNPALIVPR